MCRHDCAEMAFLHASLELTNYLAFGCWGSSEQVAEELHNSFQIIPLSQSHFDFLSVGECPIGILEKMSFEHPIQSDEP